MTKLIAQTAAAASGGTSPLTTTVLVYALFAAGFYFLLIAPQRKKQKEHDKLLASLQTGDEIMTNGGIYGTITNVKDDRFVVRVSDNTKIEVGKGFVQSVTKRSGTDDKKS